MFAFPKSARLLTASQYTDVFRQPDLNLVNGPLRTRARKNKMHHARLGLVVPKKGTRKAVARNRVKRLIRERFRCRAPELPNVDLVVQVFGALDEDRLRALLDLQFDQIMDKLA